MADYDKNKPADSDLLSQFPANERAARGAVETNFGIDHHEADDADVGKHEIVQLLAQSTPSAVAGQGHFYTRDVGAGVIELFYQDADGNEIQITSAGVVNDIESGTNMVFNQAAAPTGWTQDTSLNDRVLRVVDDTGTGGSDGGSWTISGVTVDGHALTLAETPNHNHGGSTGGAGSHSHSRITGGGRNYVHGASGGQETTFDAGATDSDRSDYLATNTVGNHTHTIPAEGGGGSHTHGLTADGNWRPLHRDVIAATKD